MEMLKGSEIYVSQFQAAVQPKNINLGLVSLQLALKATRRGELARGAAQIARRLSSWAGRDLPVIKWSGSEEALTEVTEKKWPVR